MQYWKVFLTSVFLMCYAATGLGKTVPLDQMVQKIFGQAQAGIVIQDAKTGEIILHHNADQHFYPASLMKVPSALGMLDILGPEFTFETSLYLDDKKQLYVQFDGDPSLKTVHIHKLISLNANSLSEVNSVIFIAKVPPIRNSSAMLSDVPWYFAAPTGDIILDKNRVAMTLSPTSIGQAVNVVAPRHLNYRAQVTTVTDQQAMTDCELDVQMDDENTLNLEGCWPITMPNSALYVAVTAPEKYAEARFKEAFKKAGLTIPVHFEVRKDLPSDARLLTVHRSQPLHELIKAVLKKSDNVYADAIYHRMNRGRPELPRATLSNWLKSYAQLNDDDFELWDGSGVSRYDLMRPADLAGIFYKEQNNKYFVDALAVSGEANCSLRRRLKRVGFTGKTGISRHMGSLAGYMVSKSKRELVVTIIVNRALLPAGDIVGQIDTFVMRVHDTL